MDTMTEQSEEREAVEFPHGDVVDTRELHDLLASLEQEAGEHDEHDPETCECEEHAPLLAALRELENSLADWQYGETLIADSYFLTYAQELAEDIGAIDPEAGWPNSYIDWNRAAEALQMDYTPFEIDGYTYWAR